MTVKLRSHFTQWILTLCKPSSIALARKILLDKKAWFIKFNYTPTLESTYSVPRENIFYIHGQAENQQSVLIIGHSNKSEQRNDSYNEDDVRVFEGQRLFDDYFRDTYKTNQKIIDENKAYFKKLKLLQKITCWGILWRVLTCHILKRSSVV